MIAAAIAASLFSAFVGFAFGSLTSTDFWTHRSKVRQLEHIEHMEELKQRAAMLVPGDWRIER